MDVGAGLGDGFRSDRSPVIAKRAAHVGEDGGDFFVAKIITPRRHREVPLLAFDGNVSGQAVEDNVLDTISASGVDPFRASQRRGLAFLAEPCGLMTQLASLMK